jgi:hypothetical protein
MFGFPFGMVAPSPVVVPVVFEVLFEVLLDDEHSRLRNPHL